MPDEHKHHDDHDHPHDHGHRQDDPFHVHATADLDTTDFDAANRSLAEALRISFNVLKAVVVILLLVFIVVGGYRKIEEGQVGVRVRFGAVLGEQLADGSFDTELLTPGPHFALPEPIDQVIIVPTKAQLLVIDRVEYELLDPATGEKRMIQDTGFWFKEDAQQAAMPLDEKSVQPGGLKPGIDGSLITADQNLVHGKWSINYNIPAETAAVFALDVGATDVKESLRRAEHLVRQVAQRAILHVVANTSVDDFGVGQVDRVAIRRLANEQLAAMSTGIVVNDVLLDVATPPISTRSAFNAVTSAVSERDAARTFAQKQREQLLTEAAGAGWRALLAAIDQYEAARQKHGLSGSEVEAAQAALDHMLKDSAALAKYGISGQVADMIQNAESDRTNLKTSIQAEATAFTSQYEKYAKGGTGPDNALRQIIIQRLWEDTVEEVFGAANEVFWLPAGTDELYLEFGPNPAVRKATETEQRLQRAGRSN